MRISSSRTSTAPTSRSTRRCLDTCGWASPSSATRSLTERSPRASTSRIARRRGSATALNASAVVAARAIAELYADISIRQSQGELSDKSTSLARMLASVDGAIGPVEEARIPVTDEGLTRGDGGFEVLRLYGGRPFALAEHLARLDP